MTTRERYYNNPSTRTEDGRSYRRIQSNIVYTAKSVHCKKKGRRNSQHAVFNNVARWCNSQSGFPTKKPRGEKASPQGHWPLTPGNAAASRFESTRQFCCRYLHSFSPRVSKRSRTGSTGAAPVVLVSLENRRRLAKNLLICMSLSAKHSGSGCGGNAPSHP
jgi:hypothetical protein